MIYLGSDHGGFNLKEKVKDWLREWSLIYTDDGNITLTTGDDYPDFAFKVAKDIRDSSDRGILFCRTGQGMAIAANRFSHIRAVLALTEKEVKKGREDEDANILVIPADFITEDQARSIIQLFLQTPFSGEERHKRRIEKITNVPD